MVRPSFPRGWSLWLAVCGALLPGCDVTVAGRARALSTPDSGKPCGPVTYQGCCSGATLHYCANSSLVTQGCDPGALCGWNEALSLYACGVSSGGDPTGQVPRECARPDAGPVKDSAGPVKDGAGLTDGSPVDAGSCGPLTYAGCCQGSTVIFCSGGKVLSLSCLSRPLCGWSGPAGYYDCDTDGGSEPSGLYPLSCGVVLGDAAVILDGSSMPDLVLTDGTGEAVVKDGGAADREVRRDRTQRQDSRPADAFSTEFVGLDLLGLDGIRGDRGQTPPSASGCGCSFGRSASRSPIGVGALLALLVVLVLQRRRRP